MDGVNLFLRLGPTGAGRRRLRLPFGITVGQVLKALGRAGLVPGGSAVNPTLMLRRGHRLLTPDDSPGRLGLRPDDELVLLPSLTAAAPNPRLRRIHNDWLKIQDEFTGHPYVKVQAAGGNPPEKYLVTYKVKGIAKLNDAGKPVFLNLHQAEIYLHKDYPRLKPKCTMKTQIFHPNFGSYICIGDQWSAGETLVDVIVQIGQMIMYQNYNYKNPLKASAAKWAREMETGTIFPVDDKDLYLPEPEITLGESSSGKDDVDIVFH